MAAVAKMYGQFAFNAYRGQISDLGDPNTILKVMLLYGTYTPDQDSHENLTHVVAHEFNGIVLFHGAVTNGPFAEGDVVTGQTSGASGTIQYVGLDYLIVANVSGTFQSEETITSGTKSATVTSVGATGYTSGGARLQNVTWAYDPSTNRAVLSADDVSWPNSYIAARYAVVYDDTPPTLSDKKLICYIDFGEWHVTANELFLIDWSSEGIFFAEVL